jgi:hypothetical protein
MNDSKCPTCGALQKKVSFVEKKKDELKQADKKLEKSIEKKRELWKPGSVKITHHAIDRVSTRHYDNYLAYRRDEKQGIVSWMRDVTQEMVTNNNLKTVTEHVKSCGMRWVLQRGAKGSNYTLMTVTPKNKKK